MNVDHLFDKSPSYLRPINNALSSAPQNKEKIHVSPWCLSNNETTVPCSTFRWGRIVMAPSAAHSWPSTGTIFAPQLSLASQMNAFVRLSLIDDAINRRQLSSFTNRTTIFAREYSSSCAMILSNVSGFTSRGILRDLAIHTPIWRENIEWVTTSI